MHYVLKGKKRKDGKRSSYRGRFCIIPGEKPRDVPLYTTDKQIAVERLNKVVQDEQREREWLLAPKHQRVAAQLSLVDHAKAYCETRRRGYRGSKPANIVSASGTVLSGTQSQTAKNLSHIARTHGFLCASSIGTWEHASQSEQMRGARASANLQVSSARYFSPAGKSPKAREGRRFSREGLPD
jgi:hypothetical protein